MANFKKGDKVKGNNIGCDCDGHDYLIITDVRKGIYHYDGYKNNKIFASCYECFKDSDLVLFKKGKKSIDAKFLLQYEIEEDPFEEFQTIIDIKKRIKELVKDGAHSFIVWEIKKKIVLDVETVESVIIKGI